MGVHEKMLGNRVSEMENANTRNFDDRETSVLLVCWLRRCAVGRCLLPCQLLLLLLTSWSGYSDRSAEAPIWRIYVDVRLAFRWLFDLFTATYWFSLSNNSPRRIFGLLNYIVTLWSVFVELAGS